MRALLILQLNRMLQHAHLCVYQDSSVPIVFWSRMSGSLICRDDPPMFSTMHACLCTHVRLLCNRCLTQPIGDVVCPSCDVPALTCKLVPTACPCLIQFKGLLTQSAYWSVDSSSLQVPWLTAYKSVAQPLNVLMSCVNVLHRQLQYPLFSKAPAITAMHTANALQGHKDKQDTGRGGSNRQV